jgi:hypothetical protein
MLVETELYRVRSERAFSEGQEGQVAYLEPTQDDPFASQLYDVSVVEQTTSYDVSWEGSPWMSLKVRFLSDEGSIDWFSPWDVVPSHLVKRATNIPIHVSHNVEIAFREHINRPEVQQLAACKTIVDGHIHSELLSQRIPVPMSLTKICQRLHNCFYRHMEAISSDLDLILCGVKEVWGTGGSPFKEAKIILDPLRRKIQQIRQGRSPAEELAPEPVPVRGPEPGPGPEPGLGSSQPCEESSSSSHASEAQHAYHQNASSGIGSGSSSGASSRAVVARNTSRENPVDNGAAARKRGRTGSDAPEDMKNRKEVKVQKTGRLKKAKTRSKKADSSSEEEWQEDADGDESDEESDDDSDSDYSGKESDDDSDDDSDDGMYQGKRPAAASGRVPARRSKRQRR